MLTWFLYHLSIIYILCLMINNGPMQVVLDENWLYVIIIY